MAAVLSSRGFVDESQIGLFLKPVKPLKVPLVEVGFDQKHVKRTLKLIKQAILNKQPILIYGDYDADGITATALTWETLFKLGAEVKPFIPLRETHGYGMSVPALKEALALFPEDDKKPLVITVDNGISANEAAAFLKEKGISLIITDHHQPGERLPEAEAIIHSDKISGAAVAWFLMRELDDQLATATLDLAVIGSVADMMVLTGVNRSLVSYGLKALRETRRPGLLALYEESGIDPKQELSTYHINFMIAPRLNAMGRLEQAMDSLRLLCTRNRERAKGLAGLLSDTNRQRQDMTLESLLKAKTLVGGGVGPALVIDDPDFHEGIIGLVAGKLVETYYRPAIVFAHNGETVKASARSIEGVNIIELIRELQPMLLSAGGHPMAAGLSLKKENLGEFREAFIKLCAQKITPEMFTRKLMIDAEIELNDIADELYYRLEELKPFGIGNARPVFATRDARVVEARPVGKGQAHLKMTLQAPSGDKVPVIGFGFGSKAAQLSQAGVVTMAYTIDENIWNGRRELQLRVKDIKG